MESPPPAVQHMCAHVLAQLSAHRVRKTSGVVPPLIVGVQGPQGSGKTYLTSLLRDSLTSAPHALSVAVLSIDDLYLSHAGLVALAEEHPENRLLHGRGQPGTHDVPLGSEVLRALQSINTTSTEVQTPRFDKSLFGGEGDRSAEYTAVAPPVDVVIFEGWCVGFYPVSSEEIERRWTQPVQGLGADFFQARGFRKEDVVDVNGRLAEYLEWWDRFDAFIQIKPDEAHPYTYIYQWRQQQEHHMKSLNGGKGMSDAQVEAFVDRYIPGYVFFGDGITEGSIGVAGERRLPPWVGHGLRIQVGENREVVDVSNF
ncbi:P-loop containing nucleoside triphosphate hydrolase protein [Amylocystis lapponica]|nr:P-loop containing nucleoside triphosphate hydrolase protein [Amylocystis lapponica]